MPNVLPFEWDQFVEILFSSYDAAITDTSKRWIGIGNSPNVGVSLKLARLIKSDNPQARIFVGHSLAGIAVHMDVLSLDLYEGN